MLLRSRADAGGDKTKARLETDILGVPDDDALVLGAGYHAMVIKADV